MNQKRKIIWDDVLVGYMENMGAEMSRIYGRWYPVESNHTFDFLRRLENGENLVVMIETLDGYVECFIADQPDTELGLIEARMK